MVKKIDPVLNRAWAAGVADWAMSFPSSNSGYILRFEGKDEALIRRFYETVGVGIMGERDKKDCTHTIWFWRTNNMDQTRDLLIFLAPFLSPKKFNWAAKLIAKVERNKQWRIKYPEKAANLVTKKAT